MSATTIAVDALHRGHSDPERRAIKRRLARGACLLGGLLVATELLYLVTVNALLFSGAIQRAANSDTNTRLTWGSAYSPWPGRVYVSDFRLILQDPMVEFRLAIDHARVDLRLWELLRKRFSASHVQAEGVSYRFLGKVESIVGKEARVAAFPPIEGFPRPALRQNPMPPPATEQDIDDLWSAEIDDVEATLKELWFMEFHYLGPGRVHGGFALAPLRRLRVGPTLVHLEGGTLEGGEHLISSSFTAKARVTIAPVDLPSSPGLRVLHTLSAAVSFDSTIEDLGVADMFVNGLRARGAGRVSGELLVSDASLMPGSSLVARIAGANIRFEGYQFTGDTQARLTVPADAKAPTIEATLTGILSIPFEKQEPVVATIAGLNAELRFADNDLLGKMTLQHLHAELLEARVRDPSAITRAVGAAVPLIAPAVLGAGPLTVSATAHVTPGHALVRIKHAQLGNGELKGAAISGAGGWNGAAAGHFARFSFGLRLRDNKINQSMPFTSTAWLGSELGKAGIAPE